ncbi:MAG TPA: magnesium transporter CorA family protein [Anaerolineae bacterium]|nr:magnesium transporter CorA family protein [Anaerolineae bacterium]
MLTIYNYRTQEPQLQTLSTVTAGSWVNLIDPLPIEISRISEELGIPIDYLTYPLDIDERARTEKDEGVTLIILRVPRYEGGSADIPYVTLPLGIILTERAIVTISKVENDILNDFLQGRIKSWSTGKRNRFVLQILLSTAQRYLHHLNAIDKEIDQLEDRLQKTPRNREVLELLKYQKSLVYFTTALRSNELMMERLQRGLLFKMYPDDEDLLDDVLIEIRQAIEMTGISNNILAQTVDAFGSIISNNLNVVVKLLTSMTIILTVPMLVASIYGMNVDLPFDELQHAFWIVMAIALGAAGIAVYIFWKRDWF